MNASRCENIIFLFMSTLRIASVKYRGFFFKWNVNYLTIQNRAEGNLIFSEIICISAEALKYVVSPSIDTLVSYSHFWSLGFLMNLIQLSQNLLTASE